MIDVATLLWNTVRMNRRANRTSFKPNQFTKNLLGRKFGRLSVIERDGINKHNSAMWKCVCDCGNQGTYKGTNLVSGHTKSCGCWAKERCVQWKHRNTRRGWTTPEYGAWKNMLSRCCNPSSRNYIYYGARGIDVCSQWKEFSNFLSDVGKRPSDKHSLHRINNDMGYFPSNVKWATRNEQQSNKRSNIKFTYNGRTQTAMQWALEFGIGFKTLCNRIQSGWSIQDSLTKPIQRRT